MENKPVLAVFDFCDTIIGKQTANLFITTFTREKGSLNRKAALFIIKWMLRFRMLSGSDYKVKLIGLLKGISKTEITTYVKIFYEKYLLAYEVSPVLSRMKWHQEQQHEVIIVSGGFSEYLSYYANACGISKAIGTDLETINGRYTGKIAGSDCMGESKISRLSQELNLSQYDLNNSYCYTDSISDLPLLLLVGNRYVVARTGHPEWALHHGCKIININ